MPYPTGGEGTLGADRRLKRRLDHSCADAASDFVGFFSPELIFSIPKSLYGRQIIHCLDLTRPWCVGG